MRYVVEDDKGRVYNVETMVNCLGKQTEEKLEAASVVFQTRDGDWIAIEIRPSQVHTVH